MAGEQNGAALRKVVAEPEIEAKLFPVGDHAGHFQNGGVGLIKRQLALLEAVAVGGKAFRREPVDVEHDIELPPDGLRDHDAILVEDRIDGLFDMDRLGFGGHFHRVRQEAGRQENRQNDCGSGEDQAWLSVSDHGLDPVLHTHLSEGQRTKGDGPLGNGTPDQSLGIGPDRGLVQLFDDLFITGQLDIPAKEDVPQPDDGIEPVDGQQGKAQGLPQVVQPVQMGPLVGQHHGPGVLVQAGGQIDLGPEKSQNERGRDFVTFPDIFPDPRPKPDPQTQIPVAVCGIDGHNTHTRQPRDRGEHIPMLKAVHGGVDLDLQRGLVDGIGDDFQSGGLPEFRFPGFQIQVLRRDHLPAGDQAESTFNRDGAQEPDGHQGPQGAVEGLRTVLPDETDDRHGQHQPACGDAEIQDIREGHGSHLLLIIIQHPADLL